MSSSIKQNNPIKTVNLSSSLEEVDSVRDEQKTVVEKLNPSSFRMVIED